MPTRADAAPTCSADVTGARELSLDWIYWAISWILLRWHALWDAIGVPGRRVPRHQLGLDPGDRLPGGHGPGHPVPDLRQADQVAARDAGAAAQVKELQEKHKGDRETLQKEIMELYRKEKANPLMGCLPMFLQIPVFLGLFHVLAPAEPGQPATRRCTAGPPSSSTAPPTRSCSPRRSPASSARRAAELAELGANGTTVKIVAGILVVDHDRDDVPDQPPDDPQDRLGRGPAAADDPAADALRHPGLAADLRRDLPDRCDHLLGDQQPVLARPAVVGAPQVPAAADGRPTSSGSRTASSGPARAATATAAVREPQPVQPAKSGGTQRSLDAAKANGAKANGRSQGQAVDGKALAPKPGAKPVNPKKGGPPSRQRVDATVRRRPAAAAPWRSDRRPVDGPGPDVPADAPDTGEPADRRVRRATTEMRP